jgi:hypothetical protein
VAKTRDRERYQESNRCGDVAGEEDERREHRQRTTRDKRDGGDEHEHVVADWIEQCTQARDDIPATREPPVEQVSESGDADQPRARQCAIGGHESGGEQKPRQ